jgi:hypothetical protein
MAVHASKRVAALLTVNGRYIAVFVTMELLALPPDCRLPWSAK